MATHRYLAMKDRKRYVKEDQVAAMIDYLFSKPAKYDWIKLANQRQAYLIYTLWRTGRRISEIVGLDHTLYNINRCPGLRPIDFDEDNREITFHILKKLPVRAYTKAGHKRDNATLEAQKRKKQAYVEVMGYDDEFFDTMIEYAKSMRIHPYQRIFPYHRSSVFVFLNKICHETGIYLGNVKHQNGDGSILDKKILVSPHKFRHGFSLNFLNKKKNDPRALPILQEILCHSSINVTKSYLRFDQKDKREALNEVFN